MLTLIFFILGTAVGSLASALSWRLHNGKNWLTGRSQCPQCSHILGVLDLVPILSYLGLRGRCRYCQDPISRLYPALEIAGGLAFALSYYYWPYNLHGWIQIELFAAWLISLVGLITLAIYDLRWRLLPSKLIYSTLAVAVAARLVYIVGTTPNKAHALIDWGLSITVASGIFWLIFTVSKGEWIGYGDVRLGLVLGTFLATPAKSSLMIFIASLLGVVVSLPQLVAAPSRRKLQLSYGPYLIVATLIVMLFGPSLIDHYRSLVL